MIERDFDVSFTARQAYREKQIQQSYRPVIAVHKWFARRPGSLFRALLLSEFGPGDLSSKFFDSNTLHGIRVGDPFMGGGTPLIEANRLGCDVVGIDINQMAYWVVRQEIETIDVASYSEAADRLMRQIKGVVGELYVTQCAECGREAQVKYYLWVKTQECANCGAQADLYPGYLLAENRRHPKNVLICPQCGELSEADDLDNPGACVSCGAALRLAAQANGGHFVCPHCGADNKYPRKASGPPAHRMVAIEYYCPSCKRRHAGRFFKKPDAADLARYQEATKRLSLLRPEFIPDDPIPAGDETNRLLKWGYGKYCDLFNDRQLLGLEMSARLISTQPDRRIRNALATNLSDLLRYQNMLCRYDTMALKSLDIFSIHGFPVSLLQCESNLLGITSETGTASIGSGGWANIVDKYKKAKAYCARPFEVLWQDGRKKIIETPGEWIGDRNGHLPPRSVDLRCGSSTEAQLPARSLDIVLTDPPYFSNVQYAELMDFCYVWLRRLVGDESPVFSQPSTRHQRELTGNATLERGLSDFTQGLSETFQNMAVAMKPGAPLAFTYHHNSLDAYYPVAVAILDAGLSCTAVLPCPAEMGASIHINGTGSSTVDSVFICRNAEGSIVGPLHVSGDAIEERVQRDLDRLAEAGMVLTSGDVRCLVYGHLLRAAIESLESRWRRDIPVVDRLAAVGQAIREWGSPSDIEGHLAANPLCTLRVREVRKTWQPRQDTLFK